jgi:hypothetical protein
MHEEEPAMQQVTLKTDEGDSTKLDVSPDPLPASLGEEFEFLAEHRGNNPPTLDLSFPCTDDEYFICKDGKKKLSLSLQAGTNPSETVAVCSKAQTGDRAYDVVSSTGGKQSPTIVISTKEE